MLTRLKLVLAAVFNMGIRYRYLIAVGASIILGVILVISGLGKLGHQDEFLVVILHTTFLPLPLASIVAQWLPWIELVLGSLLIVGIAARFMASFSSVLIAAFIAYNGWMVAHGLGHESCGCFGIFEELYLGELSSIESLSLDIGLLGLVLIVLAYYPGNFFTIRPWFFRISRMAKSSGGNEHA